MIIKIKIIKYLFIYFLLNKMSKLDTDELKIKMLLIILTKLKIK